MKLFFLILFLFIAMQPVYAAIPVEVLSIYDGDTIRVKLDSGNKFSIRLLNIDCYETSKIYRAYKQAYDNNLSIEDVIKKGKIAREYLKRLHKDSKKAYFDFTGVDKYGRVLGIVYFDSLNVNEELKNKGYCMPYEYTEDLR